MPFGGLVSRLSNGPSGASYGLLWRLIGGYLVDVLSQLIIQVGGFCGAGVREPTQRRIMVHWGFLWGALLLEPLM